jgi:hypothetical protein
LLSLKLFLVSGTAGDGRAVRAAKFFGRKQEKKVKEKKL